MINKLIDTPFYIRPRICCVDLQKEIITSLKKSGYNIFEGTLGATVEVPNHRSGDSQYVLLDFSFPPNFHEYDILILDLTNEQKKEFKPESLKNLKTKDNSYLALSCSYPATVFDPRPISSSILGNKVREIHGRKFIQIVFSSEDYEIDYEVIEISDYSQRRPNEKHKLYSFYNSSPVSNSRFGKEVTVQSTREDMQQLLNKHISDLTYEQTFYHQTEWDSKEQKNLPVKHLVPLLNNINDEIVSLVYIEDTLATFFFPNFKNKESFLIDFLKNILPSLYPDLFPYSTQFKWIEDKEYFVPNHQLLNNEKENLQKEFKLKLSEVDKKVIENKKKYQFIHDLITETGEKLVHALFSFLKWLEFKNVIIKDEQSSSLKEEDLQVELENGLLVIETKGIGGTSTDSDCSQISKIKHRRCKERNAFDVFGLYIVNHQRYLPPLKRNNPPFTEQQITDAFNDERGLLSTWQLFKLYNDILNGILTKEDARKQILQFGNIFFKPKLTLNLGQPKEVLKDGHVAILNISNSKIKIGDTLILEKNGTYSKAKIISIQLDNQEVSEAQDEEVGIKIDLKLNKNTHIWTQ